MSRDVLAAELIKADARALKMPGVVRAYETLAREARDSKWTHEEYLHEVLTAELASRSDSAVRNRIRDARFPEMKTLEGFDFTAADGLDAAQVSRLARCEWVKKAENVILAGPIGTGKTHLAISLGIEAAKQRFHVAFLRAADLVRGLVEARDKRELGRLQRRLSRVDLLVVDEVGFVPFDRTGGELLFNAIAARYERKSVLVTTNLAFSEWPKVFADDEKLTTALLDRLADRATVLTTRGKSFRMRRRQNPGESPDVASAQGAPPRATAPAPARDDASEKKSASPGPVKKR
jgi:DNA replication protein DnaC